MYRTIVLTLIGLLMAVPSPAAAIVKIFACEPEWASLAKSIGGDYVESYSATHARQNPHYIRARPSLIARMRGSDLVICSGADLEVGWLPILLQKAGKASVQPGGEFYLMAADMVPLLERRETVDRSMGDIHPSGNPHVHLNPHNILLVADVLNQRLQQLDKTNAAIIQKQYETFVMRWKQSILKWEKQAAGLNGKPIITHHQSWSYLINWLGLELVDTLESKPGIPPSASHLEQLLQKVENTTVLAVIRAPYDAPEASEWLAGKTSIPSLVLPYTVGDDDTNSDLFLLYDQMVAQLNGALNAQR